jgi:archaellum component FlaG (FlaF/FlaG flagellin family)
VVQGRHDDLTVVRVVGSVPLTKTGTSRTVMLEIIIKGNILMGLTTSVVRPDADAIAQLRRGSVFESTEAP